MTVPVTSDSPVTTPNPGRHWRWFFSPIRFDVPTVTAEHGQVLVDGPDGVAVSLTPDAAVETSDRLLEAAVEAQGQILTKTLADKEQAARKAG